jgi:predicted transcriptional regulator
LLSPKAFDELIERSRFVSAVEAGLADVEAGRAVDHAAVVAEVRSRFGESRDQ